MSAKTSQTKDSGRAKAKGKARTSAKSKAKAPDASGKKRILFVDDDEGCRLLVADVLKTADVEVVAEPTVAAGLKRAGKESFDLIILDLMLPKGTGGEAAFTIRENDPKIPIMALSGYLDKWDADDLKALGFTKWMGKPFKTKSLIAMVKGMLK